MQPKYPKPKVGDTVFLVEHGHRSPTTETKEVISVGRKYFTILLRGTGLRFHLDTWRQVTEYSPSYKLYTSEAVYKAEKELGELAAKVTRFFDRWGAAEKLTADQLRTIAAIIDAVKKK